MAGLSLIRVCSREPTVSVSSVKGLFFMATVVPSFSCVCKIEGLWRERFLVLMLLSAFDLTPMQEHGEALQPNE